MIIKQDIKGKTQKKKDIANHTVICHQDTAIWQKTMSLRWDYVIDFMVQETRLTTRWE